jgi:hypothetical protein
MRSIPSAVLGPVLQPPCIRQRPFGIAGDWHGDPRRVFAPHRGALEKSPGGFPFFNQPRRFAGGLILLFIATPLLLLGPPGTLLLGPPGTLGAGRRYGADDGLTALVDMDVFDGHFRLW